MTPQIRNIHIGAFTPLIVGSLVFFYWFYKRTWFAENAKIEIMAFASIIIFLLFGLATFFVSIGIIMDNTRDWKKVVAPMVVILITLPMIDLYDTLYRSLSDKVFVRIVNNTDKRIKRIWSDNFEITSLDIKDNNFIISYEPVYVFDWTEETSSLYGYDYSITPVYVEVSTADTVLNYPLPLYYKGSCAKVDLAEIIEN